MTFIRQAMRNASAAFVFAILADETFVGIISINNLTNPEAPISIDFGVAVPFWKKDTLPRRSERRSLTSKLNVNSVENSCLRENIGSKRVMEKNGS